MKNIHTYIPILLFLCTLAFFSCEKIEIPSDAQSENNANGGMANGGEPNITAYSVSDIIKGNLAENEDVYVVGYIVGYVKSTNMNSCRFARGSVETNIIIADTPVDTIPSKCIPVQLTTTNAACKATRAALNLAQNDVLGQKVCLQGDIDYYMGTKGVLKARNHIFLDNDFDENERVNENEDGDGEEVGNGDDEENEGHGDEGKENGDEEEDGNSTPDDGDDEEALTPEEQEWAEIEAYFKSHGYEDAPFTIADFKTNIPKYLSRLGAPEIGHPGFTNSYICGYIIGYIPKNYSNIKNTVFGSENASQTNVILADSPYEQDYNNCIAVQLSSSHKETKDALNLADHPENYRRKFIICGDITDYKGYMGTLGLKNAKDYIPCDNNGE